MKGKMNSLPDRVKDLPAVSGQIWGMSIKAVLLGWRVWIDLGLSSRTIAGREDERTLMGLTRPGAGVMSSRAKPPHSRGSVE